MRTANVVLVYDDACPNVDAARAQLRRAFDIVRQTPDWQEINQDDGEERNGVRRTGKYGSPTILVNGEDVADLGAVPDGDCCRVYLTDDARLAGVPSVDLITKALHKTLGAEDRPADPSHERSAGWKRCLAVLPALGVTFLPKAICPLCWPAYAAILSALGIGFIPTAAYLFPLTLACLTVALATLAWRARGRRIAPLILGFIGAGVILAGRFVVESNTVLYSGIATLVAAFARDIWTSRRLNRRCPKCETAAVPRNELEEQKLKNVSSKSPADPVESVR